MAEKDFLNAWRDWRPTEPPFLLDADRPRFSSPPTSSACVQFCSWPAAYSDRDFGARGDRRVHVGLLPHPFCGNLRRASIYLLLLNPGLGPWDYFGEYEVAAYRDALMANLRQDFGGHDFPFVFLDPRFAWHGGYTWWYGKFAGIISALAERWGASISEARQGLANELASVELFPYHSVSFRDADRWLAPQRRLPSVALALAFVANTVLARVRRGEAIIVVTRQVPSWGIDPGPGVVLYSSTQARAAHITPSSAGGKAILAHLSQTRLQNGRVLWPQSQ